MSAFHVITSCGALGGKELVLQFCGLLIFLGSWLDEDVFPKMNCVDMFIWLKQVTPHLPALGSTLNIYSPFPHAGAMSPFFPLHPYIKFAGGGESPA